MASGAVLNRHNSKQDHGTPPEFLVAVRSKLDIVDFDIDLAANKDNAVTLFYYDKQMNALEQDWNVGDGWNWLNPEFADIEPWAQRAHEQARLGAQTVMLVPASVGANWWRDHVHGCALVYFLNGRITFIGSKDPYPKDCALVLYSNRIAPGYQIWSWKDQCLTRIRPRNVRQIVTIYEPRKARNA